MVIMQTAASAVLETSSPLAVLCPQMQEILQDKEILDRLKAMRRFAKDGSDNVPFPPSPLPDQEELPPVWGWPLETWVKPADDIVVK